MITAPDSMTHKSEDGIASTHMPKIITRGHHIIMLPIIQLL